MESRIESLLERYWAGESTLEEEKEVKEWFAKNQHMTAEGQYFRQLRQRQNQRPAKPLVHPGRKRSRAQWSVAAAITVGIAAAFFVIKDAQEQREFVVEDPQEAIEITRKALLMVGKGLNEGKVYSNELTRIKDAEELITKKDE